MGWQDYHLWEFEVGSHRYGDPDPEYETNPPTQRAAGVKLAALIARDDLTFSYVYDFGEYWHTFERRMPRWDRGWRPSLRAWFARFHKNYGGLGPVDWPRDRFCRD
jgi:hypothetical protein